MELYPRNCNLRSNYITSNLRLKPLAPPSTSIKLAAFVLLKIDSQMLLLLVTSIISTHQ